MLSRLWFCPFVKDGRLAGSRGLNCGRDSIYPYCMARLFFPSRVDKTLIRLSVNLQRVSLTKTARPEVFLPALFLTLQV
jgi:hypothetical protein